MSKNTTVSLTLQIKGQQASQEMKRISDQQVTATTKINQQWTQIGNAQAKFVNTAKTGTRETINTARAGDQLLRTNRMLEDVLRQQSIQTKLQSQLYKQNVVSAQQMDRAYASMNTRISSLQNDLGKVERSSINTSTHALNTAGTWKDAAKSLAAMYGTMQAMNALKTTVSTNLDFERDVLEMKQNAGMTPVQANQIRQVAIESANYTMQTPQEVLKASKSFARAGDKFEDIKGNTIEAARAATVFRSTPEEVANMDFDLRTKMGIKNSDIPAVNNMLYYHGNSGRFEAPSFAKFSPEMLSAMSNVGIKGVQGANFTGALTQVLMNKASVNEPSKVKTYIEQGLGHITSPHYVKGLAKFGIDVEKYMPNGKFYGDGGTQGLLDLTEEMKRKGLTNPFNLAKAGFSDQETAKFWLSMMQYNNDLIKAMQNGNQSAKDDQIGAHLNEMQQSNFGKVKQAEIAVEKAKLSDSGQKLTDAAGTGSQLFAEHPVVAAAGAGAAGIYGYKTFSTVRANGILSSSKVLGRASGVATVGFGAYDAYSAYKNPNLSAVQKKAEYTKAGVSTASTLAGGYAGAQTGAMVGAGIGAFFGGVGAVPGAAIGGVVGGVAGGLGGWWLGDKAGEELTKGMTEQTQQISENGDNQVQAIQDMKNALLGKIDALITATNQNKPTFNFGGSLLDGISQNAQQQEKRHGAPPSYMLVK
ncbi:phage tail tape measure protein [Acinetobacter ursingii]|uniref:phage tail tape measure protein n=1 Tax=Acinetobacter ursingii TaxID=108980 RepID=UPI003AF42AA1